MNVAEEQRTRLPYDVMIDILKRLPAKSLLRLKCVSKTWYDLTSSNYFISTHYSNGCISSYFILFKRYLEIDENDSDNIYYNGSNILSFHLNEESFKTIAPNIEYIDNYIGVSVIGPCNGIICISSYRCTVLFNPTLRETFELPPSILPRSQQLCPGKELNSWVLMSMGIGFDSTNNDYKVIRIVSPREEYEMYDTDNYYKIVSKVEVYNLSTNSWRKIEDLQCLVDSSRSFNVWLDGAFHWRGTTLSPANDCWIVSFNVSTELFQNIPFPLGLDIKPYKSLFILDESLALVCYTKTFYRQNVVMNQSVDIWLMKKYSVRESWFKKFTLRPMLIETPLSVWMNDAELMIESKDGKLISYNLLCGKTKELEMSGVPSTFEVVVCRESLISIEKERAKWS